MQPSESPSYHAHNKPSLASSRISEAAIDEDVWSMVAPNRGTSILADCTLIFEHKILNQLNYREKT